MTGEETTDRPLHHLAADVVSFIIMTIILSTIFLAVMYLSIEAGIAHPDIWDVKEAVLFSGVLAFLFAIVARGEAMGEYDG